MLIGAIMSTCPYKMKTHHCYIYVVKFGFTGVYKKNCDIFLIFAQNIDCGYTCPYEYPQSMF